MDKRFIFLFFLIFIICNTNKSEQLIGWASLNGGTTGGSGGEYFIVNNREQFINALSLSIPRIIQINDTIFMQNGERIDVDFGKLTIEGITPDALVHNGGIIINGDNVIIRNINFGNSYIQGCWDGKGDPGTDFITVKSKNVWIDHCDFFYGYDGLLDVSTGGDFVTISWCKFSKHNKVMLIGSSDKFTSDRGHLRVTIHHCWFDGYSSFTDTVSNETYHLNQRMPRVRYGDVHVFNNYYEGITGYCIAARIESDVVVENCFFRNLKHAHIIDDEEKGSEVPELVAKNCIYENVHDDNQSYGNGFNPSDFYNYALDPVSSVPALVMNGAGIKFSLINKNPVANNDTVFLVNNKKITIYPLQNDFDPENKPFRIASILAEYKNNYEVYPDFFIYYVNQTVPSELKYEIIDYDGGIDTAKILIVKSLNE
ncbi:MAG: hypothetical protein JXB17_01690 [Bacteroidales bacterium]|nr:hypothetical protein [Bacteroidales bacterium]